MRMEFDHQHKLISIWLAGDESSTVLDPVYRHYQHSKYKVAVFRSGNQSLEECTAGLLLHNRM